MLLKGGGDVTFLVRPRRAAQLAERGLVVKSVDGEVVTGVRTVQAGEIGGPYDVVFLDLDRAIDEFLPALAPNGAVLPVLNGINHIAVLQDRLGAARVLGGVVIFLVTMTPAGEIVVPGHGTGQTSFGELTGERSARCEAIRAALAAGGVASTVSEKIVTEMWGKFCGMTASSTVAVVTCSRAGAVATAPAGAAFVAATFDECARVTTAEGYPPPANIREIVLGMWSQPGSDYGPSMLHDLENGRPTEGDHIIGDMVRRADRLGVAVPILRAALCNLQIYEAHRLQVEPSALTAKP